MEQIEKTDIVVARCLNCGTEVSDRFCPHCGQSVSVPERITNRGFGKSILSTFSRWNSGFLNTLINLSYRPWDVIKDYIHGKQVNYSHPVTMIIQVSLYTTFIIMFIEGLFEIEFHKAIEENDTANWFVKTIKDSTVLRSLWVSVPFIIAAYLTYWKHGSRRFTFSEYVIAALYFMVTIRVLTFVVSPINYFLSHGESLSSFNLVFIAIIGLTFGIIMITKAFPIQSKVTRITMFVLFIIISLIVTYIYIMISEFIEDVIVGSLNENWINDYLSEPI